MKAIIPLYAPPNSGEWQKLFAALEPDGAAQKATVIINPAGGPGPDGKWNERKRWLAIMDRLASAGVRMALYLSAQDAQPDGRRMRLTRRNVLSIKQDIGRWREFYLAELRGPGPRIAWWIDHHPCGVEGLMWPEIEALYEELAGAAVIANLRAMPLPSFAKCCEAETLCIHEHDGWPPLTRASVGGKRTALMVCATMGLIAGAKHTAEYLYATPAAWSGGVWGSLSPILPRILELNAA